jgi:arylsulfatase A-like enzyme
MRLFGVMLCALVASLAVASEPSLTQEPFDRELSTDWHWGLGTWAAKDGVLRGYESGPRRHGPVKMRRCSLGDGVVECDFRLEGKATFAGIIFNGSQERGHIAHVVMGPSRVRIIAHPRKGEHTVLFDRPIELPIDQWHPVRIAFQGETVTVTIGGETITATHPCLAEPKQAFGLGGDSGGPEGEKAGVLEFRSLRFGSLHRRPNVLVIFTDDHDFDEIAAVRRWSDASLAGLSPKGPPPLTPHVDRLIGESMLFPQCHVGSVVCTPSRYCLLTGQYASRAASIAKRFPPHAAANVEFNTDIEPGQWHLGRGLAAAGYRTGFVGKWHNTDLNRSDLVVRPPICDYRGIENGPQDPALPENVRRVREAYDRTVSYMRDAIGFDYVSSLYMGNANQLGLPKPLWQTEHNMEWFTAGAVRFLEEQRDATQPFFLYVAPNIPHGGGKRFLEADPRATPEGLVDWHLGVQPSREDVLRRVQEAGGDANRAWTTWLDDGIGVILEKLAELGLDDDTIVVLASDQQSDGKWTCYEGARVPLAIRWPGHIAAGRVDHALVSSVDIAATILDLCGVDWGDGITPLIDGRSIAPLTRGETLPERPVLIEMGYGRAVIADGHKYIAIRHPPEVTKKADETGETPDFLGRFGGKRDAEQMHRRWPAYGRSDQLYDLRNDPLEQRDLAGDPAHADTLAAMRAVLREALAPLPHAFGEFKEAAVTDDVERGPAAADAKPASRAQTSAHPNVLFIIADDQGYSDFGFTGNPLVKTPSLDRLAAESAVFKNFVVAAACSPSRSAFYTGRDHLLTGVWGVPPRANLRRDEALMPAFFQAVGYETLYVGKGDMARLPESTPWKRGWDDAWTVGGYQHRDPKMPHRHGTEQFTGWTADIMTDLILKLWRDRPREKPWFVTAAFIIPHLPFECDEAWSRPFRDQGLSPQLAECYGSIAHMDACIGRLLDGLRETGQADNTIVVFTSDNGMSSKGAPKQEFSEHDWTTRNVHRLRGHKAWVFENGIRVPLLIRWPEAVEPGDRKQFGCAEDILPTVLDLAGVDPDAVPHQPFTGVSLRPAVENAATVFDRPDAFRLAIAGAGSPRGDPGEAVARRYEDHHLVLRGSRFKYHALPGGRSLLCDIETDPGETTDVSDQHAEVTAALAAACRSRWEAVIAAGRTFPSQE